MGITPRTAQDLSNASVTSADWRYLADSPNADSAAPVKWVIIQCAIASTTREGQVWVRLTFLATSKMP